jgi:hypothetical protein
VEARDDLHRERAELEVFAAAHGDELRLRHAPGAGEIDRALGADDDGAGLARDVRHVESVIEVRVRVQDEVRARDVGVDRRRVRHELVVGAEDPSRVSRQRRRVEGAEPGPIAETREVGIEQDRRLAGDELPAGGSEVPGPHGRHRRRV